MVFSTPSQLLVLCAVAVFAWLLGFAANPTAFSRGNALRRLLREFSDFRAQAQGRMNNLTRHAAALEDKHNALTARLGEAEAKLAAMNTAAAERSAAGVAQPSAPIDEDLAPVAEQAQSTATGLADTPDDTAPEVANLPHPAGDNPGAGAPIAAPAPEPTEGWLASGTRDTLTRIDGIDANLEQRLFDLGIARFEDIEKLSDQDEMALELRLALPAGYIAARQWRTQAARLRGGETPDDRFGPPPIAGV